jgi:DNA-directed RNA polymerase beta subunit
MLLCDANIISPADRDSFSNKRIHDSGVILAKAIKTHFNKHIVHPILNGLRTLLKQESWKDINESMINSHVVNSKQTDFTKYIKRAMSSGKQNLAVGQQTVRNRGPGSLLERKNQAHVESTLRNITTINSSSSNSTERATLMRHVHPSMIGFICISQSADTGEAVGMKKQLAITSTISRADSSISLKRLLSEDKDVVLFENASLDEMKNDSLISINGEWIGYCKFGYKLVKKYRQFRRESKLLPTTTIAWDAINDDVDFWLDTGRIRRPLLIVYNNIDEYDEALRNGKPIQFKQWIKFTEETLIGIRAGKITLDHLINEAICEYITCE